jgi:hypothetical protein
MASRHKNAVPNVPAVPIVQALFRRFKVQGSMFNVLTSSNVFRNTNLLTTKKIHERF